MTIKTIQLGKNGITDNFILGLVNYFKTHTIIKISVLKNARGEGKEGKEEVKKYAKELVNAFGEKYTTKIIGFTIIMRKWRKSQTQK